jgi:hypothetical protein
MTFHTRLLQAFAPVLLTLTGEGLGDGLGLGTSGLGLGTTGLGLGVTGLHTLMLGAAAVKARHR